jgi:hypothetical protein
MLDAQDGQAMPVSVRDVGQEDLTINASVIRARRYTVTGRYSQERLVRRSCASRASTARCEGWFGDHVSPAMN